MKTQYEKILYLMAREKRKWFYPHEFMQPSLGENFVGYEASARLSELTKKYPGMFEVKTDGKYVVRKLNIPTSREWYPTLPTVLKRAIWKGTSGF